jgi:hypothetical protein
VLADETGEMRALPRGAGSQPRVAAGAKTQSARSPKPDAQAFHVRAAQHDEPDAAGSASAT